MNKYLPGTSIPFNEEYRQAKWQFIGDVLVNPSIMNCFGTGTPLPEQFGVGLDERCVEYPWLFSHLKPGVEQILDAGSTSNHSLVIESPILHNKKIHILTLAPEKNCFWQKGISYLYADLRNIPMRDAFYNSIVCVSTLNHVGCDSSLVTHDDPDREPRADDFLVAVREMRRVLKPDGTLFLTVPFGVYRHFGIFQQFDRRLLSRAIEAFGYARAVRETFYRYTVDGWNVASSSDCASSEYVHWAAAVWQGQPLPKPLPIEPDMGVAARAVACVELTRES